MGVVLEVLHDRQRHVILRISPTQPLLRALFSLCVVSMTSMQLLEAPAEMGPPAVFHTNAQSTITHEVFPTPRTKEPWLIHVCGCMKTCAFSHFPADRGYMLMSADLFHYAQALQVRSFDLLPIEYLRDYCTSGQCADFFCQDQFRIDRLNSLSDEEFRRQLKIHIPGVQLWLYLDVKSKEVRIGDPGPPQYPVQQSTDFFERYPSLDPRHPDGQEIADNLLTAQILMRRAYGLLPIDILHELFATQGGRSMWPISESEIQQLFALDDWPLRSALMDCMNAVSFYFYYDCGNQSIRFKWRPTVTYQRASG